MTILVHLTAMATAIALPAQAAATPVASPDAVAAAAREAMHTSGATGLAIAVIDRGRVVSVQAFGHRNAAGDPLTTDTIMYAASITKTVFAYGVMRLVDQRRIDLDRPIAAMLPRPLPEYGNRPAYGNWGDLAGDPRWRAITPRMVLTHSTGFANFAFLEPDRRLRFHFDPGTRFAYSGEGFSLLQFAIDEGLKLETGALIQSQVFDRLRMPRSSLIWRADFASNLADGWHADGRAEPHDARSRVRAAGSLDTTIADLARFAAALVAGDGLSVRARRELVRPILPITTRTQFPTLQPEAPPAERHGIAAGLGVIVFGGPQGRGFFKGGHNDWTANTLVCLERRRRCVLILSNDVRAERTFPALLRAILGETGVPYRWEYGDAAGR